MIIYAFSDLDVFEDDIQQFLEQLKQKKEPDLLLLAGDIYNYRKPEIYRQILSTIKKWKCPIVAVFGNREFPDDEDWVRKVCKDRITFLQNESVILNIKGETVGIIGSRGALDHPTFWQMHHLKNIYKEFGERIEKLEELAEDMKADIKILLTHYAPTYKTLLGEHKELYSVLGSKKMEQVVKKVDMAVHGHSHYGAHLAFVGKTPVYNVAYLVTKDITVIDTDRLPKA